MTEQTPMIVGQVTITRFIDTDGEAGIAMDTDDGSGHGLDEMTLLALLSYGQMRAYDYLTHPQEDHDD